MDMASDEIIDDKESINENVKGVEHFQKYINSESKKAYLHQVVRKMEHSPGQRMYLAYWDFAGQSTYYNTHQAFMSPSAVYLLVVDLSKSLDQKEKSTLNFRTHRIQEISVLESVRFWTGSIKAYTADENKAVAPVIVVGTHKDKVQPERIEHIFEEIREVMRIPEVPCIAINNTLPSVDDSALKELRDRIVDGGIGIIETEIPAKWIELEYSLIKLKNEGKVFLSFEELQSLDLKTDAPLSDQTLLNAFLEHEHCRGFLMYFPHGDLKDIIILDPLILVSFINQIMRKKPKLSDSLRERASQSGWCSDGVFDQTFLNEAINNLDATCTKKTDLPLLVKVCIHLKLIYPKTKASLERNTDAFNLYFMPCLLEDKPDKVQDYSNVDAEKTPMIKISFEKKPIPPAFFHSLLASLLSEWPPQKIDNNGKIYNEYVCFCLEGETCILEMYWSESNIYLRIINFSIRRKLKDINCYKYIVSVEQHIGAILQLYRHVNIDVFIGVRCPKHEHAYVSLKKLVYSSDREAMCHAGDSTHHHSVVAEDVLNTWFPDESIHYKPATTKEPSREQKELEKVPNDKCLGRLSRLINFEDAHSLATKLKMDDPSLAAKRATEESPHSKNLALFKIMKRWREMNDSPTTETLLDLLTKRQLHRRKDIVSALFKDVKQQRYDQQLQLDLDKPPTDRQCGIMGQYIDQYVFVFLELGHSYVSIERAREEVGHYQIATTITNLLIQWKNKFNENASIRNFLDVAKMFNLDVDKLLEDLVKNIR